MDSLETLSENTHAATSPEIVRERARAAAVDLDRRLERQILYAEMREFARRRHKVKVRRKENARRRKAKAAQTARRRTQAKASRRANR